MTTSSTSDLIWAGVGLLGQGAFTARFLVQLICSERNQEVTIPRAFWWLSLAGGLITLTYGLHLQSAAIVVGQTTGLIVYSRNLMLAGRSQRRVLKDARSGGPPGAGPNGPNRRKGQRPDPLTAAR